MKINNCTVCGLPSEACLHQKKVKELRKDYNVSRMLWFSMGFLTALSGYFLSCSTDRFSTMYRIKTPDGDHFVNEYKVIDNIIYCEERKRNGTIVIPLALPFSTSIIQESK